MDLLKSFISLLALINPVGAVPFFLSLTSEHSDAERRRTIRVASISVFCVIAITTLLGQQIISFFGISVGSLEVGGGIIMLLMAINMLNAQVGNARATPEERAKIIDVIIGQNRLYALAADRAGEPQLARVLRAFNPILEDVANGRSESTAADLSQLSFELRVMQARLGADAASTNTL